MLSTVHTHTIIYFFTLKICGNNNNNDNDNTVVINSCSTDIMKTVCGNNNNNASGDLAYCVCLISLRVINELSR